MLISKFNRMIRNRFVWGFFAFIVCLAFVGGSLKMSGCGKQTAGTVGTINGEEISGRELEKAMLYELGFKSKGRLSDSQRDELSKQAWKRLATLKHAEKLGVVCTRQEIDSIIVNDPRFHTDGSFDQNKYEASIMQELGVSTEMLEEYMAQEIVLNRMMLIAGTMLLTPPSELAKKLERLTDIVEADYAFITNDINTGKVKVSGEEVRDYFEKNIDLFRIPEKITVSYAVFPVQAYTSRVSVAENAALDYYDSHISDYSSRNTNDELVTVAFTNVQEEITTKLIWEEATYAARDNATALVMDLMPNRDGIAAPLQDVLTKRDIELKTSPFFSMFETVAGVDAGYDFNRAAFSLVPTDPERRVSDAVVGTSNVYVIIAGDKTESRLPSFDEVKDEVEPYAKKQNASKLFDEKVEKLRKEVVEKVAAGTDFRKSLEKNDIKVFSTPDFSVYSDMTNEIENSEVIVPTVIALDRGETSELIPTAEGYMLIHVKSRKPGDLLSAELLKPQLVSAISRYRAGILFQEMQDSLLTSTVVINERPAGTESESEEREELPADLL